MELSSSTAATFQAGLSNFLRKFAGISVDYAIGMSERHERLAVALVLVGVMLLFALVGGAWLPLSANTNLPRHDLAQPALRDWPQHFLGDDRA
jgi:hypothetical protein